MGRKGIPISNGSNRIMDLAVVNGTWLCTTLQSRVNRLGHGYRVNIFHRINRDEI
jgi:hypothetical protein